MIATKYLCVLRMGSMDKLYKRYKISRSGIYIRKVIKRDPTTGAPLKDI